MKLRVGPVLVLAALGWFAAVLTRPATRVLMPTPEAEPNNTAATANPLVTALSPIGARTAAISPAGDVDFYSVTVTAPATLFVSGDGDPERDGVGTDIVLDLIAPDGTTVLLHVDNT